MRLALFCLSFAFGGCLVFLAGCASPPPVEWEPRRPAALVPERCDMGMLRMTKGMRCADELHRAPLWGRS